MPEIVDHVVAPKPSLIINIMRAQPRSIMSTFVLRMAAIATIAAPAEANHLVS